jgi:hypothetical protein
MYILSCLLAVGFLQVYSFPLKLSFYGELTKRVTLLDSLLWAYSQCKND